MGKHDAHNNDSSQVLDHASIIRRCRAICGDPCRLIQVIAL